MNPSQPPYLKRQITPKPYLSNQPPSHAQINTYINSCSLSLSLSCMSFTPTTPTMYPISLWSTYVNNSYIPSPSISSILSTNLTPLYLQTQSSELPNTNTIRPLQKPLRLTPTSHMNINTQAMPLR